ncbi:MAG: hypothetical protein ACPG7U_03405 [Holosporaceae bacterium]
MSRSGNILLAVALLSSSTVEAKQAPALEWDSDCVSICINPQTQEIEDHSQNTYKRMVDQDGKTHDMRLPTGYKISDIDRAIEQYPRTFKERCKTAIMGAVTNTATAGKAAGDIVATYQLAPLAITGAGAAAVATGTLLNPYHPFLAGALQASGWSLKNLNFFHAKAMPAAILALYPPIACATGFLYRGIGQGAVYAGNAGSNLMRAAWTKALDADFSPGTSKPSKPEEIEMKTFHDKSWLATVNGGTNNRGTGNPPGGPNLSRQTIPQSLRTPVTEGDHPLATPSSKSLTQDQLDLLADAMQEEMSASIAHLRHQPGETMQAWNQRTKVHWFGGSGPSSLTSSAHSTPPASLASISSTELNDLRNRLSRLRDN